MILAFSRPPTNRCDGIADIVFSVVFSGQAGPSRAVSEFLDFPRGVPVSDNPVKLRCN